MNAKETKQVDIKIGGETKSVSICRLSADYCWDCSTPVLLRFPTGNKVHRSNRCTVHERKDGTYFLVAQGYRNANRATIYAWDNGQLATSKW